MQPSRGLGDEVWAQVRREWEGVDGERVTVPVLAKKYGVSDVAIYKRMRKVNQPGGPWVVTVTDTQKQTLGSLGLVKTAQRLRGEAPDGSVASEALKFLRDVKDEGLTEEEAQQVVREMAMIEAADIIAEHNQAHLKRVGELTELMEDAFVMVRLLMLTDDEAAQLPASQQVRRKRAEALFLPSDMADITKAFRALTGMMESVQKQTRKALGLDSAKRAIPASEADPPRPSPFAPGAPEMPADEFDITTLDTTQLEKLYEAVEIVQGQSKRDPFLVPPGTKRMIDG